MANYDLITIRKGEIKTIDSFINSFNAIGSNMKAICVSAFKFMTSDDKDLKIEFQKRVFDELNLSPATLSQMKNSGMLYLLDDRFSEFAYTNVVYFKKVIDAMDEVNENTLTHMFEELAKYHNSRITEGFVESLVELSQKELRNLIDKYLTKDDKEEDTTGETEETEDETEETTEETPSDEEINEVNIHYVTFIDDDINTVLEKLTEIIETPKMSKAGIMERLGDIKEILLNSNI